MAHLPELQIRQHRLPRIRNSLLLYITLPWTRKPLLQLDYHSLSQTPTLHMAFIMTHTVIVKLDYLSCRLHDRIHQRDGQGLPQLARKTSHGGCTEQATLPTLAFLMSLLEMVQRLLTDQPGYTLITVTTSLSPPPTISEHRVLLLKHLQHLCGTTMPLRIVTIWRISRSATTNLPPRKQHPYTIIIILVQQSSTTSILACLTTIVCLIYLHTHLL